MQYFSLISSTKIVLRLLAFFTLLSDLLFHALLLFLPYCIGRVSCISVLFMLSVVVLYFIFHVLFRFQRLLGIGFVSYFKNSNKWPLPQNSHGIIRMTKLKFTGVIPPLFNASSWRCAYLSGRCIVVACYLLTHSDSFYLLPLPYLYLKVLYDFVLNSNIEIAIDIIYIRLRS